MSASPIERITFWRRKLGSIEGVQALSFTIDDDDNFSLSYQGRTIAVAKEDYEALLQNLTVTCRDAFVDPYLAYKYEEDKNDFGIFFFLSLDYRDATYRCLKGIHPFKQPHYKDIQAAFEPFFNK